ncbi:MAG: RNA-binding S4 domain-containing protein [Lachnospiraceae bacterium]
MDSLKLKDEFIKLGQAIKAAGYVDSGVEAKLVILDGLVKVNGEVVLQRGKKLYENDVVTFENHLLKKKVVA